ncbi:hypothetical protein A1G_00280 [Rickettsia rickettsii str. 'Sheila Smith']|uniref:Uncharacterized protein n=1 Tax=Rickettsia rickettsii (strain Sheila Smith) TaxID=392021 RepID=A0A0H3AVM4_RICRS|nr:hypothetical protein A1G_00280 [Rickettsia rickettsii str. 'Sheila Smith']
MNCPLSLQIVNVSYIVNTNSCSWIAFNNSKYPIKTIKINIININILGNINHMVIFCDNNIVIILWKIMVVIISSIIHRTYIRRWISRRNNIRRKASHACKQPNTTGC